MVEVLLPGFKAGAERTRAERSSRGEVGGESACPPLLGDLESRSHPKENPTETEASRNLVLDYLAAQGRGDGAKMMELLDEKVQWRPPAAAGLGAPTGRNAVLQAMGEAGQKFFDLSTMKSEVKWIVAEGDRVIIRQHAEAKAANGRAYSNEYVWVYLCRGGKIVEIEEHTDSQRFAEIVLA